MARQARVLRFLHYRTWTEGRAVPCCDPTGRLKVSLEGQLTPDKGKVTCGECVERLKEGEQWPK